LFYLFGSLFSFPNQSSLISTFMRKYENKKKFLI
jgi:hypothetical protein